MSSNIVSTFRIFFSARMLVALSMGFASGLPLLLTGSVLQAWMREEGIDLGTIGLFALVGLPYTLKFLWAPVLDRYTPSFLGRRRGWLLAAQLGLIVAIATLGLARPGEGPLQLALTALVLTFFSATQDIVIDAYRREALAEQELGLGAAMYVNGYRFGMLLASGGGLLLADRFSFPWMYGFMACVMAVGVVITLLAPEPPVAQGSPRTLYEAVVDPFKDYFQRQDAFRILLFILLYKIGDTMASHMSMPFYLDLGFSMTQIGSVVKLFGFWATVVGGLLGGLLILRLGIYRSLWSFGILQSLSTLGFVLLVYTGNSVPWLAAVIAFENLSSGMGTAAYAALMAHLTNKKFTATQYALLSSLMGIPRVIVASPTGYVASALGWETFFFLCAAIAVPGLLLLTQFRPWLARQPAAALA
ncbi:MAG: AmpG family muropeptide MFS transporter [Gammaproteobacteria bacterium]